MFWGSKPAVLKVYRLANVKSCILWCSMRIIAFALVAMQWKSSASLNLTGGTQTRCSLTSTPHFSAISQKYRPIFDSIWQQSSKIWDKHDNGHTSVISTAETEFLLFICISDIKKTTYWLLHLVFIFQQSAGPSVISMWAYQSDKRMSSCWIGCSQLENLWQEKKD